MLMSIQIIAKVLSNNSVSLQSNENEKQKKAYKFKFVQK